MAPSRPPRSTVQPAGSIFLSVAWRNALKSCCCPEEQSTVWVESSTDRLTREVLLQEPRKALEHGTGKPCKRPLPLLLRLLPQGWGVPAEHPQLLLRDG